MSAVHSPGPWRLNEEASHPWLVESDSNIPGIAAEICKVSYKPNARLVAAAPELLEALERLLNAFEQTGKRLVSFSGKPTSVDLARAAIVKAKGGAS